MSRDELIPLTGNYMLNGYIQNKELTYMGSGTDSNTPSADGWANATREN